eukprot:54700-Eustigmatos_ZCMA.PRE.1
MGHTINDVRDIGRSEGYLRMDHDKERDAASHAYPSQADEMLVEGQVFVKDKLDEVKGAEG